MDNDWDLGEGLDPEGPSGSDLDRFGDEMTPCRSCGGMMYDQAEICPHCGSFTEEPERAISGWVVFGIVVLVGLLLFMLW